MSALPSQVMRWLFFVYFKSHLYSLLLHQHAKRRSNLTKTQHLYFTALQDHAS